MNDTERRAFTADVLKIEARAEGKRTLVGHAAVFNQLSEDLGGFREQITPGAFIEAIEKDDVRALFNHDPNFVLGRNRSKTLELTEDARGLAIEIDLPDTPTIRDLVVAPIERGDVSQMSFAFSVRPGGQDWAKDDEGRVIRTLKKLRLFDVSPVTYPAYPQTDVAARALEEWRKSAGRSGVLPSDVVAEITRLMPLIDSAVRAGLDPVKPTVNQIALAKRRQEIAELM
ncbi:MAG: HK97 family phage prohead protease [Hyphomicrobiaceae bacterium]